MREKALDVHCYRCGAVMTLTYHLDYNGWEPLTELPSRCPKGHTLPSDICEAIQDEMDQLARDGVGDPDPRDLCGYTESRR